MDDRIVQIKQIADSVDGTLLAQQNDLAAVKATLATTTDNLAALTTKYSDSQVELLSLRSDVAAYKLRATSPLTPLLPTIFTEVQARTDWIQPANAGDSGGSSGKPNGTFKLIPGKTAQFSAAGNYEYNNGYWYVRLGGRDAAAKFYYRMATQFPTNADLAASQGLEFELQQVIGGKVYNMAWQAPFREPTKKWRTFDYTASRLKTGGPYWIDTTIALDPTLFANGKWIFLEAEYERKLNNITHVALTINGNRIPVGVTRPGFQDPEHGTSSSFNAAYQLDSLKVPVAYRTFVENMQVHVL